MSVAFAHAKDLALDRGHTSRGYFVSSHNEFDLAYSPTADLDGWFEATCLETGHKVEINGPLYVKDSGSD